MSSIHFALSLCFNLKQTTVILIAESSSTKTEWCITSRNNNEIIEHFITDGINPFFQTRKEISHMIRLQLPPQFFKIKCNMIYFYCAGCANEEKKNVVKASLEAQFRTPAVIESDLLGAARSLFQRQSGIACILGTGSNSCFYDGEHIVKNVKALGYILGDEGSGAVMGKCFLADCLKGLAPKELVEPFYNKYRIDEAEILDFVYTKESPNKMLSVLSFFLAEHLEHEYVDKLVRDNFKLFFERNLLQYDFQNYPVRFVGSVAYIYSDVLKSTANVLDISIDEIKETSLQGLIQFHKAADGV